MNDEYEPPMEQVILLSDPTNWWLVGGIVVAGSLILSLGLLAATKRK